MRAPLASALFVIAVAGIAASACTSKPDNTVEGGIVMTTAEAAAPTGGPTPTCLPCSAAAPSGWAFYNQFADAQCKRPIAQATGPVAVVLGALVGVELGERLREAFLDLRGDGAVTF